MLLKRNDSTRSVAAWSSHTPHALRIEGEHQVDVVAEVPVRIVITSVGIDLPIVPAQYDRAHSTWAVVDRAVNVALETYPINDRGGVTFMYGHNNRRTLGATKELKLGDTAIVMTESGRVYNYTFVSSESVKPDNTSLFNNLDTRKPTLKLMTCQGFLSSERRIMTFTLESVQ